MEGQRSHVMPDEDFIMDTGDIIIQLGHVHSWDNSKSASDMLFVMIGGDSYGSFDGGETRMVEDIKPVRRIIAGNDSNGDAVILEDKLSPDVKTYDNRPGFSATRIWVQEATPAPIAGVQDTLHLPDTLEPLQQGPYAGL